MMLSKSSHEKFMDMAIQEAVLAVSCGDVPVGAVAVIEGEIVSRGHNKREAVKDPDPTAHAEMVVIRECAEKLGRWRLNDITLYVTIEPCVMCAGAIVLARIPRVVFGVYDAKFGGGGSVFQILQDPILNHRVEIVSGVREDVCKKILQDFFRDRRMSESPRYRYPSTSSG